MALKKSELYSSLWSSCDELRGGMDASQYKDYVLVLLFVKYVSDKYAGVPFAPITIPEGASFKDMVALKGKSDIGDQINKKILGPLANANKLSDMPDFADPTKLGSGKEMVDRLTNLIAIFENPSLDFSKNRADGDDILGDAYEYLMRHFATESGKSKGQFYTPAEVSRIIAQFLGIRSAKTSNDTTVYDPTCGSGSLLLKVGDEASHGKDIKVTLYGQEKDSATSGLARMNMILHNNPTALIKQGNTLASPLFTDASGQLKTFDYVVANPPFSDKRLSTGFDPANDPFERFKHYGVPPAKQGDYAYLLHILRSLKSGGKGACILPHGVLFRGNAEAVIRKNLVQRGYPLRRHQRPAISPSGSSPAGRCGAGLPPHHPDPGEQEPQPGRDRDRGPKRVDERAGNEAAREPSRAAAVEEDERADDEQQAAREIVETVEARILRRIGDRAAFAVGRTTASLSDNMQLAIELEREADGRWIAEVPALSGVLTYGTTRDEAVAKVQALALRVLAERLEQGEEAPALLSVTFQAA
ncbi:MAG: N-6 DNA methylase [Novosphingobium sp.]|nr:N-6 DNA methylase [Novosphingobium sp.]